MVAPVAAGFAAAAYRATQGIQGGGIQGEAAPGEAGAGFGAVVQRALEGAVQVGHGADAAATQALTGQGSVTDLVMALSHAELALQTAVAVRDRVVSAYQDVMRMPI